MKINNYKPYFKISSVLLILVIFSASCRQVGNNKTSAPEALRDISALKLNFRFEADVPEPSTAKQNAQTEERIQAVQSDFDANRNGEALDKTILSPDKQSVLAIYHLPTDTPNEYRLDMYMPDGKLLRKITPDSMAVHFPDTIVWSPDSSTAAFVAMIRYGGQNAAPPTAPTPPTAGTETNSNSAENTNAETNANAETNLNTNTGPPVPETPGTVLTFRTEQIYSVSRDGSNLKALTQNEGLIYFYFVWSPDSSALAALAATWREWQVGQAQTDQRGEIFIPSGRPRLIEKNGRIRILDDNVTAVHPVWSPDSAKVALAFDKDVRIYDAIGDSPTQAGIPLRNQLLLSSKTFDDGLRSKEQSNTNTNANANVNTTTNANANANVNANVNLPANLPAGALPDENMLVSFNPIIKLDWGQDSMLYLQTGYVKEMKDSANSAHSYLRWHRLVLSPQPSALN